MLSDMYQHRHVVERIVTVEIRELERRQSLQRAQTRSPTGSGTAGEQSRDRRGSDARHRR
jgi:hypothetical protein